MFWNNVKAELDYQGLLVKELAEKTGLNFNSLCNGMSRNTNPTVDTACKIAAALNVSVEYLYSGARQKNDIPAEDLSLLNDYHLLTQPNKDLLRAIIISMIQINNK